MPALAQTSAGASYPFIFSGGGSFASFPLLDSPLPFSKSKGELLCIRLLCFLQQTAPTRLHVNGAGGDQARWFTGLLGQAAGQDARRSQHIVNVNFVCLFLDTRLRDLCQYPPE